MSEPDPWKVYRGDDQDAWEARQDAIDRGLRACGWTVFDAYEAHEPRWPQWAACVYHSFPASVEVVAVRVVAEGPKNVRDAVVAAYALGGWEAIRDFVESLLREAQGELAGGRSTPEETI